MIYSQLYCRSGRKEPVKAALIGVGNYGTALLTQSAVIPELQVAAIADRNLEAAKRAFALAGVDESNIAICSSREEALRALPSRRVIVEDPFLLMDLPLDIIAECTGMAEAGARHAAEAIQHGKHVAMVSKEPDSVVGPILKQMADAAGVVYTQVDGDQHGLLMGLLGWAQSLGLEIVCAGKSRDGEVVFDDDFSEVALRWNPNSGRLPAYEHSAVPAADRAWLGFIPEGECGRYIAERARILEKLPGSRAASFDMCESVIAANATGLVPDLAEFHQPIARITEIPRVLCSEEEGGILKKRGVIDLVTCLRGWHESGLGGGVFAVVSCANEYSRKVLITKGLISNPRETAAVIYRPHHLCGVETPTSLLCAVLLGVATGALDYRPRFDMIVTTSRPMKAGDLIDCERDHSLKATIVPALAVREGGPLPANLASGKCLSRDLPAGAVVTREAVDIPEDSFLMELRRKQDDLFGAGQH